MTDQQHSTLIKAIEQLGKEGYTGEFVASGPDKLKELHSEREFEPEELGIVEVQRFEGPTDPDDSAVLYVLEGPKNIKGLLTDAFGPYADPNVSTLVKRIPLREKE